MNFKRKLYLGFGSVVAILIIIAVFGLYVIQQQDKSMDKLVNEHYERVRLVTLFQFEINNTARMVRDVILKTENGVTREEEELINISRKNTADSVKLLHELEKDESVKPLINKLDVLNQSYEEGYQIIIDHLKEGRKAEATKVLIEDYRDVRQGLVSTIAQLTDIEEAAMNEAVVHSKEMFDSTLTGFIYLITSGFVITILITIWVIRSVVSRVADVNSVISNAAELKTNKLPRIEKISKDEIGEIAIAYNGMAEALETHMEQENELKEKMKIETWIKTNWAEVVSMYQGIQDLQTFAQLFISKITPKVEASYGVFYMKSENEDKLYRLAAYAAEQEPTVSKGFQFGEGLVGQAALENKKIIIDTLPDNYMKIKSGLGQSSPKNLCILPIEHEGKVMAVVELGSFKAFDDIYEQFLEIVIKTAGISLKSIAGHMKIEKLLAESQTLTEELQSQSEELQQQQEELRMINEQLEEQYKNSEEKAKELEMIQYDLEEKNRHVELSSKYKSEFLANMSHELRTPLNSMLILSQLLADNNENNLTYKQVEYANTIHASGRDLLDLINDILDLSKIESGKMAIIPEEVLFTDIKYFVEHQFSPIAKHRKLDFEILIDDDLPYVFITDNQRLKQILKNLLSNAFKFTKKGKVSIEFKLCNKQDNHTKAHRPMVAISVTDTGIGIPEDKQQFIFEAFNQADGTTSRQFGGTGLGLSISRELAQLLGGYIEVNSSLGNGSTFTLYLPEYEIGNKDLTNDEVAVTVVEKPHFIERETIIEDELENEKVTIIEYKNNQQSSELKNIKELLAGKKVLLVDDDMRNIFSLTTALEMNKMIVEFAENGKEAIDILQNQKDIDLVLMDIMMPVMNGYDAIQTIRQMDGLQTLPIIALTAKAMKHDREKCLDAGASDYISKPVNLDQLLSLIRVWLYR